MRERRQSIAAGRLAAAVLCALVVASGCTSSDDDPRVAPPSATRSILEPKATTPPITDQPSSPAADSDDGDTTSRSNDSGNVGASGGGQSSNRPPVIESPGITSDGLRMLIEPEVSDPDGDDVTLLFNVDGVIVDPAQTCTTGMCEEDEQPGDFPRAAGVSLDFAEVGYRSVVPVTITATDSHGATAQDTFSHEVTAQAYVTMQDVTYAINDANACLAGHDTRILTYTVTMTGAVDREWRRLVEIDASTATGTLPTYDFELYTGEQPPPLNVHLSVRLSDIGTTAFASPRTHTSSSESTVAVFRGTVCEGSVTYIVEYEVQ